MNTESAEIIRKAKVDLNRANSDPQKIARWQYEDIILSVMKSEVEQHVIIYHDGMIDLAPAAAIYQPFAEVVG